MISNIPVHQSTSQENTCRTRGLTHQKNTATLDTLPLSTMVWEEKDQKPSENSLELFSGTNLPFQILLLEHGIPE